jgi:hypothetical protein
MALIFISIIINFFIESLSWYIKAVASPGKIAKSISISNMILYSSRIFNYLFITSISIYVDKNSSLKELIIIVLLAMFSSSILHYFFFTSKFAIINFKRSITTISNFNNRTRNAISSLEFKNLNRDILDTRILSYTTLSSYLFSATLILPYVLTYFIPQYKLTIVSFGSVGNFLATMPLIFYVDFVLHSYMDKSILLDRLYSYILGRALGFLFFAITLTLFFSIYFDFS